jgi:protease YdgD
MWGALLGSVGAMGRDLAFPGIIGTDDRRPAQELDTETAPIGKVQAAGFDWNLACTGTLISPVQVVTSARCLLDPEAGLVPAAAVHFLAGVFGDKWMAHATGACIKTLATMVSPDMPPELDVAILVLKRPIRLSPLSLASDRAISAGSSVIHPGYARDRAYRLSVDWSCHVQRRERGIDVTDCDTNFGEIGGPLLVRSPEGALQVAGVIIGGEEHESTFAVPVDAWRHLAETATCR